MPLDPAPPSPVPPEPPFRTRWDLGIPALLPAWRKALAPEGLREDVQAALTVACVGVPLSLAIAMASGVDLARGLASAILGSMGVALFGGTPLAVTGPTATLAVLLSVLVQRFGVGGLLVAGLGCGALQLATGILGWGRFVRYVPLPVISGFTAGIGAIVLVGQLPRALGLPAPDASHVPAVLLHLGEVLHRTDPTSAALSGLTLALALLLPRWRPRWPAALVAVLAPSLLVAILGLPVATIGALPRSLPGPSLPNLPPEGLGALAWSTLILFSLASLETLLSSSAIDKLARGPRHDPDQELIGQGLANLLTPIFGGIPVTGVIARSALNVQAGARTRRAAFLQGLVLLLAVHLLAPVLGRIPTAVLAGVLLSVALRMLHPAGLLELWRSARPEAVTYLVTFTVMVFVDLVAGVQAGIVAALVIAALRAGRTRARLTPPGTSGPSVVSLEGPLTFLASPRLDALQASIEGLDLRRGVVLDLSQVTGLDASGSSRLLEVLDALRARGCRYALRGLDENAIRTLDRLSPGECPSDRCATCEEDVHRILGTDPRPPALERLLHGVARFRREAARSASLYQTLAGGQRPHTLFVTCSDSRIDPNRITSTEPGELFIVRNVGNLIPPFGLDGLPAEGAAIEFAVGILGVGDIVLCGHSGCGAMKALLDRQADPAPPSPWPCLDAWLGHAGALATPLPPGTSPEEAARLNAVAQMENLRSYPLVRARLEEGSLRLHAWFYDIGGVRLEAWDGRTGRFQPLPLPGGAVQAPLAPGA